MGIKITFKDLGQHKFTLEFEESQLISEVKEKISQEKGWEPQFQKLIYSGKILKDSEPLSAYKIEEKGFVVCMVSKPKPKPATQTTPSTPAPASNAPTSAATVPTPAAPQVDRAGVSPATNQPSTPTPPSGGAVSGGSEAGNGGMLMGTARTQVIADMEAMGFERAEIERAMRAAFFNPDRAVEYLLNGIPESAQARAQQSGPAADTGAPPTGAGAAPMTANTPAAPAAVPAAAPAADNSNVNLFDLAAQQSQAASQGAATLGAGAGVGASDLDFLRENRQFQQLRQLVQQQPQMLEPILQQLSTTNPELAQIISSHPDQFLSLLNEDGDEDAPLPPGAQAISVTPEEHEAIERLCNLGFDRDSAIQAYFACDKNEELAANFLFEQDERDTN